MLSAAGVGTSSRVALGGADVGALAAGRLLLGFGFLVVVGVFSLVAAAVADSAEALVVVAGCGASLAESIVAINLLELRAQALFCLGWREELLQLLDGLSDLLFVACIVSESDAEHLAHLSQVLDREVEVLVSSSGRSAEGRLQSERVDQLELLPHDHSSRGLFGLLDLEVTVIEVEVITVFVEQEWEDSLLQSVGPLVGASIHEQVLAS